MFRMEISEEYRGIKETFEKCKAAVDETFEQHKNKSEEEKKLNKDSIKTSCE